MIEVTHHCVGFIALGLAFDVAGLVTPPPMCRPLYAAGVTALLFVLALRSAGAGVV